MTDDKTIDNKLITKNRRRHETVRSMLEGLFAMASAGVFITEIEVHTANGGRIETTTIRGAPDVNRKPNKKRGPRKSRPRKQNETEEQRKKRLAAEHSAAYRDRKKKAKAVAAPPKTKTTKRKKKP